MIRSNFRRWTYFIQGYCEIDASFNTVGSVNLKVEVFCLEIQKEERPLAIGVDVHTRCICHRCRCMRLPSWHPAYGRSIVCKIRKTKLLNDQKTDLGYYGMQRSTFGKRPPWNLTFRKYIRVNANTFFFLPLRIVALGIFFQHQFKKRNQTSSELTSHMKNVITPTYPLLKSSMSEQSLFRSEIWLKIGVRENFQNWKIIKKVRGKFS